jgi:VanZ family protein
VRTFLRVLFWCAIAATLYTTLRHISVAVPGSDKTHHAVTFGALTALAIAAYSRSRLIPLGVALSGFGAAIELIQPYFERSRDVWDWVADNVGIIIVLAVVVLVRAAQAKRQRG